MNDFLFFVQVCDTNHEVPFLAILQHLLRIDTADPLSDIIWDTVEKLVYRASLLESRQDRDKIVVSGQKRLEKAVSGTDRSALPRACHCTCHQNDNDDDLVSKKMRMSSVSQLSPGRQKNGIQIVMAPSSAHHNAKVAPSTPSAPPQTSCGDCVQAPQPPPPPPPPPPPLPGMSGGAPPPPPPPLFNQGTPSPGGFINGIPPPPPPGGASFRAPEGPKLPQQQTPIPKTRMRKLQWSKIPSNHVLGKNNVWTQVGKMFSDKDKYQFNFEQMEELFSVGEPDSAKMKDFHQEDSTLNDRKKKSDEINLLDNKRSLNVNIFLRQFHMPHSEIIKCLAKGESEKIGAEKLRGLLKILPSTDEVEMIKGFTGDSSKLGSAEKFLLELISLPNYSLRVESMLIKEEFKNTVDYIKPAIDAIILAAGDLKDSKALHEIIYMVLIAGNFLNAGGYSGDAAGFKLGSLLKLTEIRANKPRMNLMHYVAMQAEKKNPDLLRFTDEFKYLKEAAQYSVDSLTTDIKALRDKIISISEQLKQTESDFQKHMISFLQDAKSQMSEMDQDLQEMEELRCDLAGYFCEDESMFKLEECLKIFSTFCDKFHKAVLENKERQLQEEKAEVRRKQREEMLLSKKRPKSAAELKTPEKTEERPRSTHSDGSVEQHFVDDLLGDQGGRHGGELGDGEFIRTGSLRLSGRKSSVASRLRAIEEANNQREEPERRSRKPSDEANAEHLISYLLQADDRSSDRLFEKNGSLRGRRRRPPNSKVIDSFDRERAVSPVTPDGVNISGLGRLESDSATASSSPLAFVEHFGRRDILGSSSAASSPSTLLSSSSASVSTAVVSETSTRVQQPLEVTPNSTQGSADDRGDDGRSKERERRRLERHRRSYVSQSDWQNAARQNAESVDETTGAKSPTSPSRTIHTVLGERHTKSAAPDEKPTEEQSKECQATDKGPSDAASLVSVVRRGRDRNATGSQSSLYTPRSSTTVENRRWSTLDNKTDINDVIRDVEKTGREIEQIGKNDPEWPLNSRRAMKRQRLLESKSTCRSDEKQQALQIKTVKQTTDSGFESSGSVSESSNVSPDSPNKSVASPISERLTAPLRLRLDSSRNSTLTERALDEHCSGRWKDEKDDTRSTEPEEPDTNTSHLGVSFRDRMKSRYNRPYSTYDNVPSIRSNVNKSTVSHSSSDISADVVVTRRNSSSTDLKSDGDTKRWGCVFDDEKETPAAGCGSLKRSNTLPRRWRFNNDDKKERIQPSVIEEEDKAEVESTSQTVQIKQESSSSENVADDEKMYFATKRDTNTAPSFSLLNHANKSACKTTTGSFVTSGWRNRHEIQELDSKVQEFQSRTATDKAASARKAKFEQLSKFYQEEDNDIFGGWNTNSGSAKTAESAGSTLHSAVAERAINTDSGHFSSSSRPDSLNLDGNAQSPRSADETITCKSDNESVVSGRDEGFESESISDPSVSQRTSMSSTLESELNGTSTQIRDDADKQATEDEQEDTESSSSKLFARSIDSLVHKAELTIAESIDFDDASPPENKEKTTTKEEHQVKQSVSKPEKASLAKSIAKSTKPVPPKLHTTARFTNRVSSVSSSAHTSPIKQPTTGRSTTTTKVKSGNSPSVSGSTTPTKVKSTSGNKSTAAAVTARLTRPRRPSTLLKREGSNSSLNSEMSTSSASGTSRRPSRPSRPSTAATGSSTSVKVTTHRLGGVANNQQMKSIPSPANPFVRGAGVRATMPASVLRANKKAAAAASAAQRDDKEAPVPPRRTSSIRATERLTKPTIASSFNGAKSVGIKSPQSPASRPKHSDSSKNVNRTSTRTRPSLTNSAALPSSGENKTTTIHTTGKPSAMASTLSSRSKKSESMSKQSPTGLHVHTTSSSEAKSKSPSFIRKIMDKSKERKSPMNKKNTVMSSRNQTTGRVTILSPPLQSSRC
ncbi:hypothetical protein LSH36_2g04042 [Paralvinella palmiformis]|uniref:FH2 domain-containing protein n=1 Tax=Paralvinella palmiformis TaxID=53620 RepID=A0AAD9NKI8_9ANNE|nr:hypothetical protein LSH36_2g04042 [Paralvinella palmiformis]